MFNRTRCLQITAALASISLLAGCGLLSEDDGDGKKRIVVGTTSAPSTLDPAAAWDGSWELYRNVYQTLLAFRQKGWAVEDEGRWHFTVPGFLISNTLIGLLLEAQANGRIEGTPWLSEAYAAEEKISIPKSEEEMFTELYQQRSENRK